MNPRVKSLDRQMFDKFQNGLKQWNALLPLLCNCVLEYTISKAWVHQLLFYANVVILQS